MKRLIVMMAAILLGLTVNAQSGPTKTLDKKIRFGFKIDMGSTWLGPKESYITKDGGKFYFSYGFAGDFMITDNYAIATGLNITHAGGNLIMEPNHGLELEKNNIVASNAVTTNAYKISLQYVEIPFGLKLKTDDIKGMRYWGLFGTYLGINIGSRTNATIGGLTFEKEKITSYTVPVNMGLDLGAGVEIPFNNKTYGSFGLGFRNGFIDVTKQKNWNDGKVILNSFFLRTAIYF